MMAVITSSGIARSFDVEPGDRCLPVIESLIRKNIGLLFRNWGGGKIPHSVSRRTGLLAGAGYRRASWVPAVIVDKETHTGIGLPYRDSGGYEVRFGNRHRP